MGQPQGEQQCYFCDICHAEEEQENTLVACSDLACLRCPPTLRAHSDCLQKWHDAQPRPPSLLRTSSISCFGLSSRSRSTSSLSADLARRVRGALSNPRLRLFPHSQDVGKLQRSCSATASPSVVTPTVPTTASCGDLRRLEEVFEPRLAPYTPPLRLRSCGSTDSLHSRPMSAIELDALENMVFEPRDVACTPPLRRLSRPASEKENETEAFKPKMSIANLQQAVGERRVQAKEKSSLLVEQLRKTNEPEIRTPSQITIRQLARLSTPNLSVGSLRISSRASRSTSTPSGSAMSCY